MRWLLLLAFGIPGFVLSTGAAGGDWPQFRYDAGRTAASPEGLALPLHLQWVRELPAPRPAFPGEVRLRYDASYEPVVLGKTIFVPSMVTDTVMALDTETGLERWHFFADGPVRFAPVAWRNQVYFVSDDGCLYCLDAADGRLRWKFRGLPSDRKDRKVFGNQRLISLWPARGGPVLAGGRIYFAAGLWPGDGVFIYALDAQSGEVVWSNTDSNRIPEANMDHGIGQFAGLTPQGYLAVVGGKLVVPCGAQLPAFLDLETGQLGRYCMGWGGRNGLPKGSWFVAGVGNLLSHSGDLYDMSRQNQERFRQQRWPRDFKSRLYAGGFQRIQIDPSNQKALGRFRIPVLTPDVMYVSDHGIAAYDLRSGKLEERSQAEIPPARRNDKFPDRWRMNFPKRWTFPSDLQVHIKAGRCLYLGGPGVVEAVQVPDETAAAHVVWRREIEGTPHRLLAADGKLLVVTREGRIYAFGQQPKANVVVHRAPKAAAASPDRLTPTARKVLEMTGTRDGYAVLLGIGWGRLAEQLIGQSDLYVIGVDPDAGKVAELRERLYRAGRYGTRASLYVGDPLDYPLPPYLANLVVLRRREADRVAQRRRLVARVVRLLRPYGGTAMLAISSDRRSAFSAALAELTGGGIAGGQQGDWTVLSRPGPLPGSADWSHPLADAANTGASRDELLKAPLGLVWFDGALRWYRKPGSAQVRIAGGRVLVRAEKLQAIDVYTGRPLWQAELPLPHEPADQLVAAGDAICVTGGRSCVVLDPASGRISRRFDLPDELPGPWANLRISGHYLVAQSGKYLVCLDRHRGQLVWKFQCGRASLSLAVGGGKVFCAELVNPRRGELPSQKTKMRALDLETGQLVWETVGGWSVRYSEPSDLLVTSAGIYRGRDGTLVVDTSGFDQKHGDLQCAPLSIIGDRLLWGTATSFVVYELPTGRPRGDRMTWVRRGCTGLRASRNLLTTRYRGNCAYIDLAARTTTPLWNIRPGCNNNMIPADGVLNIPCLTGGCECNYTPASQAYLPKAVLERSR